MHALHFITRLILGGAQENTLLTCEGQHAAGDRVTLVTGPGLGPEGDLMRRAAAGGYAVRVLPGLVRNIAPCADAAAYRAARRLFAELRPDLVHTHSGKAGVLGRAAASALGIPVVHTIHGPSFHPGQHPLAHRALRAAERWAGRRTDRFISVADAMTEQYVAAGVAPADRFVTVRSGMEVEPFLHPPRPRAEVRRELGFAPHDVVAAKVARLFPLKGHEFVLDAAERLSAHPDLKFLLIGDGILRGELERRVAAAGLTGRVLFTGLVPPARIPELLHASDLAVHCSLREGLARVLPQALISARPVVSFDVDGAREVCLDGVTGRLLPPHDVPALTAALAELAADPDLRRRMGEEGRRRFTDPFRHTTMVRQIRAVQADVLAGRSRTSARRPPVPPGPGLNCRPL